MMFRVLILFLGTVLAVGCNRKQPEMYEYSPLASLMQEMVDFNQEARLLAIEGKTIKVPSHFYDIMDQQGTRNEQEEDAFRSMATLFLARLKELDENPSPAEPYRKLINACIHCHNTYCGGPLETIKRLQISLPSEQDPEVE